MKEEGYVINTVLRKRLNGTQQRCIVIDREKIPVSHLKASIHEVFPCSETLRKAIFGKILRANRSLYWDFLAGETRRDFGVGDSIGNRPKCG
jgi:hypothetical protein